MALAAQRDFGAFSTTDDFPFWVVFVLVLTPSLGLRRSEIDEASHEDIHVNPDLVFAE